MQSSSYRLSTDLPQANCLPPWLLCLCPPLYAYALHHCSYPLSVNVPVLVNEEPHLLHVDIGVVLLNCKRLMPNMDPVQLLVSQPQVGRVCTYVCDEPQPRSALP